MFCIDHEFGLLGAEFTTELTMSSFFAFCQTEINIKTSEISVAAKIQRS